jgi:excisionase family DNA binding protein
MSNHSEWVSLRHAAEILGVHPATVRNWADRGELPSRRTPGGHRRFRRTDLMRMSATQQPNDTQRNEVQLILQNALGQARMHVGNDELSQHPWYRAMSDETRNVMREQGRVVLEAMRAYLDNGDSHANLAIAVKMGKNYAAQLTSDKLTLPQAMRGFFYFSDFVLESILDLSDALHDRNEWSKLLRQVNDFNNTMLLSIVEYYDAITDSDDED